MAELQATQENVQDLIDKAEETKARMVSFLEDAEGLMSLRDEKNGIEMYTCEVTSDQPMLVKGVYIWYCLFLFGLILFV